MLPVGVVSLAAMTADSGDGLVDAWARAFEDAHGPETGWVAEQLLSYKRDHLDGDLTTWSTADVEQILLELMPRKSSMDAGDIALVVPAAAGFLRWLASTGRAGGDLEAVAGFVEGLAGRFVEAMHNPANWGMAKTLVTGTGLTPDQLGDPGALQAAMDRFNAMPFAERDRMLGPSMQPGLPPARLQGDQVLDVAACQAVLLQRVTALVNWVGERRVRLTDRGNLRLADARALLPLVGTGEGLDPQIGGRVWKTRSSAELRGLDQVLWLAIIAQMLADDNEVLTRGSAADLLAGSPREAAAEVLDALLRLGAHDHWVGEDRYGLHWYADLLDQELAQLPLELYPDAAVDLDELTDKLWQESRPRFRSDANAEQLTFVRDGLVQGIERMTQWLIDSGCVAQDGRELSLTRLGVFAVQRQASRAGVSAPVVGAWREAEPAALLAAVVDLPEQVAAGELDEWLAGHDPARLCAALGRASETARGLVFRALLRHGPAAQAAVEALADDDALWPLAQLWRADVQLQAPTPVTDPARLVQLLDTVIQIWGAAAVGRWAALVCDDPAALVALAWRVPGEATSTVLAALGDAAAPGANKKLAKIARTALNKLRSAR